jgi:hypothetical protein
MKVQHKVSKQVISVPNDHANMLMGQGWEEYVEVTHAVQIKETKTTKEVVADTTSDKPKRGRPAK